MELFGGIGMGFAAMLEAGLTIRQYIYVNNSPISTRVARHYLYQLMVLYPQQLHLTAIYGCFGHLLRDATLISNEDLQRLGIVDLVITGWPCQGHSRTGAGRGLENPMSSLFLGPHPAYAVVVYPPTFHPMRHI